MDDAGNDPARLDQSMRLTGFVPFVSAPFGEFRWQFSLSAGSRDFNPHHPSRVMNGDLLTEYLEARRQDQLQWLAAVRDLAILRAWMTQRGPAR